MESILESIKKLLGLDKEYLHFDADLIIQINSILAILNQLGVGEKGFKIRGYDQSWSDFLGEDYEFDTVKTYVYLRVRLLFDPPTASHLVESMAKMIQEFEWRSFVYEDNKRIDDVESTTSD